jgi:FtsH-binding integral membrane protein
MAMASPIKSGHVTTEATRKFIKVQRLIALVVMFVGMGLMMFGASKGNTPERAAGAAVAAVGFLLLMLGISWRVVLRVLQWWHHA